MFEIEQLTLALAGRYRIERELGGGGMSRVFLATETAFNRSVVVKVVAQDLLEGLSAERFAREVQLVAQMQQANIVPLLSAGDADGLPFYVMPFVDGRSLRERLQRDGTLPIVEAVHVLHDVAKALAHAHAHGIVHRDIKPENILLSGGAAMVIDFGIAKALTASRTHEGAGTALTQAGSSMGTPAYMAPEQAIGGDVDHRADLYAWGVIAYELLSGAHPFARHLAPQQLIAAHVAEVPAPLDRVAASVPPSLAALVMQCLAKDPPQRPASATDVLRALDAAVVSVVARPSLRSALSRRQRAVALAVAGTVVAVTFGTCIALRVSRSPTPGKTMIAVLPFGSIGGDTANAYFAEGIADELGTALARLPGVELAGRVSAAKYKRDGASAQEIGRALNVIAVLDGTVRRDADHIRVSTELASGTDGRVLWKETYDRQLRDVFAVQDDITRAIVAALQVRLGAGGTAAGSARTGTPDVAAYDLYLRGLQSYRQRGAGLPDAERYLEQAIARDSGFARAHATLALVLLIQPYYLDARMRDVLPRARAAALRAVALDSGLAEAYQALGHAHQESFEWVAAERDLQRALSLSPSLGDAAYRLGFTLLTQGRVSDAATEFEHATTVDPLHAVARAYLGLALVLAGHVDAGVAEGRRAVEMRTSTEVANSTLSLTLMAAGRRDEALAHARQMLPLTTDVRRLCIYAAALSFAGDRVGAQSIIRRIEATPRSMPRVASGLAFGYLALGDTARALAAIEQAAAGDGDLLLSAPPVLPLYDPVRGSARFAAVLRRFNLDVVRLTSPSGGRPP